MSISKDKSKILISNSAENTRKYGREFSKKLKSKDIIVLSGDLGSGKTTFVQGIALGFGIKKRVRSSSFILINEYKSKKYSFYHVDLYRINCKDLRNLGLDEYLFGKGICVIEWADKINKSQLPYKYEIKIEWLSEKKRKIEMVKNQ